MLHGLWWKAPWRRWSSMDHLLSSYGNPFVRPVLNSTQAVHVTFSISVDYSVDLDERNQVLTTFLGKSHVGNISVSICPSVVQSACFSVCLSHSLSVVICLRVFVCVSVSATFWLSEYLFVCSLLYVALFSMWLSSLCLSMWLYVSMPVSQCQSPSLSLWMYLPGK
jgi:hypothetical protein